MANKLDFMRGNIIKYIMRFDIKNGYEDLIKARTYLDKLISANTPEAPEGAPQAEDISKIWTVSTANITKNDNDILERNAFIPETGEGIPLIFRTDAGFIVVVDDMDASIRQFPEGLSAAFGKLHNAAFAAGIAWLNLDRDAVPAFGFEVFEWS